MLVDVVHLNLGIDRTNRTRYTIHSRSPYHSLAGIRQNHTDRSRARQYDAELPPTARRPQEFRSVGRFPNSSGPHQRAFPRIDVFPTKCLEEQPVLHAITYQPTGRERNYFQSERCTDEDDRKESRYKKPIRHVRPRNRLTVYEQKIRKGKKKAAG